MTGSWHALVRHDDEGTTVSLYRDNVLRERHRSRPEEGHWRRLLPPGCSVTERRS